MLRFALLALASLLVGSEARAETSTVAATSLPSGVELSGYVQVDYVRLDRSSDQLSDGSGLPLNEDRFFIRRARLRLDGEWKYLGLIAETELAASEDAPLGLRWLEGFAQWSPDADATSLIRVRAGLFPVPFGYEMARQGDRERLFGVRSLLARAFVPGRFDLGAGIGGRYRWLVFDLAVQNGQPLGDRAFPESDPNAGKDVSGRVGVDAEVVSGLQVTFGISGLRGSGFSAGRPPTKDDFIWRDFNEDGLVSPSELQSVRGSAATPSENFARYAFGADLRIRGEVPSVGTAQLYGEIATGVNIDRLVSPADPGLIGRDQRSRGFMVAFVQKVLHYGLVGVRYDYYDPDADATDPQGGVVVTALRPFSTWTFAGGAMFSYLGVRLRLLAEYALEDNSLGRDETGRPAKLDNNVFRSRMELTF